MRKAIFIVSFLSVIGCKQNSIKEKVGVSEKELKEFSFEPIAQVMVAGTYHFAREKETDVLSPENKQEIEKILAAFEKFQPTKVVLEIEPEHKNKLNEKYRKYRLGSFSIDTLPNEIYQLGFRLAHKMGHDSIYLFDDQTPFIGSLENFSFGKFNEYATQNDSSFTQKYIPEIISNFSFNDSLLKSLPLYERICLINSPQAQKINAQRMHMYEIRVGIGENWMGPDWLGHWYRRNIRMVGNLLKISDSGDRLLVIVGDNHKWVLEDLMNYTPDLEVQSAYEYLKQY